MKFKISLLVFLSFFCNSYSQVTDSTKILKVRGYPFIVWDSPSVLPTMRQLDEDYLSTYRYASRKLYEGIGPRWGSLVTGHFLMH